MNESELREMLRKLAGVPWRRPPEHASGEAVAIPGHESILAPCEDASASALIPEDVRGSSLEDDASGTMLTRKLDGANVTLLLVPPAGDGLWTLQGRIWTDASQLPPIRVVLSQEEHVLDVQEVEVGETFEFQEILLGQWFLEFHLSDGKVLRLSGPEG